MSSSPWAEAFDEAAAESGEAFGTVLDGFFAAAERARAEEDD